MCSKDTNRHTFLMQRMRNKVCSGSFTDYPLSTISYVVDTMEEVEIHDTSIAILDETMTTIQQTHNTDINNMDETMATLQLSMSDLEDIVDSVEDDVTALNVENDEIQQRLIVLEETLIGIFYSFWSGTRGGSMILRRRGRQSFREGRQPMILPNFPKNCMKLRKLWTVGGALLTSATGHVSCKYLKGVY